MKKKDDFSDLANSFAKVYNIQNAKEVFDGSYDEQVKNPAFIGLLTFNCMLMNTLYGCSRGGCVGCRARALFDTVTDPALKAKIEYAFSLMEK